jgi:prepilin-type N-terminal cleavage/methylation domain-containing protein
VKARNAGMTLVELVIALAMVGAMVAIASATLGRWADDQRATTSARSVADAFGLARAEAIRTGSNHLVAFDVETGLAGISSDIVIVNDGAPGAANCRIDADEIVHRIPLERGVRFGSDPSLANGAIAPDDSGTSGNQLAGASFADASGGDASWVLFMADGLPRRFSQNSTSSPPCTDVGPVGDGGGAIYLTNGRRDYAVVLSPLGTSRLHRWTGGGWAQ